MLSDRCPVVSVCDIGVLWPNGCMDQDETWHGGRPRPWPRCVRWENSNLYSSKIAYLLSVDGFGNTRRRIDHISDPPVAFGEIRNELRT